MDDSILMSVGNRSDHLFDEIEGSSERDPFAQAIRECSFAEFAGDDETPFDEAGVFEWQDIGMVELCDEAGLALERIQHTCCYVEVVRHLQSHADTFDGVEGLVDVSKPSLRDPSLDPVFTEALAHS